MSVRLRNPTLDSPLTLITVWDGRIMFGMLPKSNIGRQFSHRPRCPAVANEPWLSTLNSDQPSCPAANRSLLWPLLLPAPSAAAPLQTYFQMPCCDQIFARSSMQLAVHHGPTMRIGV